MILQVSLFILSFVILYLGAELALSGSEKIGKAFGLSPLAIGMLLVGLGTSLPELFVSQIACFEGEQSIALGNIIGSNVANIFLILGISSLLIPLPLEDKETHFNVGLHLMASLVLLVVMLQSKLYWFSSLALAILFAIFLWRIHRQRMHNKANEDSKYVPVPMTTAAKLSSLVKIILGFYSLYLGGEILVKNGSFLSLALGIPPYVLSVIMVAFGTSFPELATALLSIWRKKETGLIVGNIIGSNVFNVCFVLASLWPHNVKLPFPYLVETSILLFVSIVFVILCRVHRALNKVVGSIFLMIYLGLIFYWYQAPG